MRPCGFRRGMYAHFALCVVARRTPGTQDARSEVKFGHTHSVRSISNSRSHSRRRSWSCANTAHSLINHHATAMQCLYVALTHRSSQDAAPARLAWHHPRFRYDRLAVPHGVHPQPRLAYVMDHLSAVPAGYRSTRRSRLGSGTRASPRRRPGAYQLTSIGISVRGAFVSEAWNSSIRSWS